MATVTSYAQLTLKELANRRDPDGQIAAIVEALSEDNEIMQDAPYFEGNDYFSNRTTRRSSLPSGSWRKINEGVGTEASGTVQVIDTIGILETYSEVDKILVDSAPNPKQFRSDEDMAFVEGLGQTLASTMFYGNSSTTPEQFTGLAPRMDDLDATNNVIGGGGTGSDLTSIWIVQWGRTKVHMVYPRNYAKTLGISHEDLGRDTLVENVENSSGVTTSTTRREIYRSFFQARAGLVVRDAKCIARYANIESSGSSNIFDEDNLIKLMNRMKNRGKGATLYVNPEILSQMQIRLKDKTNVNFTLDNGLDGGGPVMRFNMAPIRISEQILLTESALT